VIKYARSARMFLLKYARSARMFLLMKCMVAP
jgi:hypothetical protein